LKPAPAAAFAENLQLNQSLGRFSLPLSYPWLWKKCLEPAYERLRGKKLPYLESQAAKTQYLPSGDLAALQWRELAALLEHARQTVPFYRDFFASSGLSVTEVLEKRDISLLPLVTPDQLMADPGAFRSETPQEGAYPKATGGSTGQPLRFWVCGNSDQWRNAMTRRGYGWAGAVTGKRTLHVWGRDVFPPSFLKKLKVGLHKTLIQSRLFYCFDLSEQRLDELMGVVDDYAPKIIVAFTNSLELFPRHALKNGWRPSHPLEAIVVGAEKLFDPQREVIEKVLGCPVFESYGSREFMLIAMECQEHRGLHISADNLMVEVVDEAGRPLPAGERGELLITDLHNYAQPFIRYKNGDLATMSDRACPCGRTLPMLENIEGRLLDVLRGPDGRPLDGAFFPHAMKEFPEIKQFQVKQTAPDALEIRLVADQELSPDTRERVSALVWEVLPGMRLDFKRVAELEKSAVGKIRVTIGLDES